jgi:hypothetical protein
MHKEERKEDSDEEKTPLPHLKKFDDMLDQLNNSDITIGEDHEKSMV